MKQILFGLILVVVAGAQPYTRGIGIYPGDPREDFAASLVSGGQQYRNLALHRPAYQSSAYDYNLTAQLITDGIQETTLPRWVVVSTSAQGLLPKADREHLLDHNLQTTTVLNGANVWIELQLMGAETPLEVDAVELQALRVSNDALKPSGWQVVVTGDDGELGRMTSTERPPAGFRGSVQAGVPPQPVYSVPFTAPARSRKIRIELSAPGATRWTIGDIALRKRARA